MTVFDPKLVVSRRGVGRPGRPRASSVLPTSAFVVVALLALTRGVRADEPPAPPAPPATAPSPSAESRLTEEQRAFLRRRIPDFDRRPAAEREKMAANVLKLWSMSPEDRAKFLDRVRRAQTSGPGASAIADVARKVHAISGAILATLPPAARDLVTVGATPTSLTFAERIQLEQAIAGAWHRKIVEGLVQAPPIDAEPSAESKAAAEFVASRDAVKAAGGAAAPEADRRRFAKIFVDDRFTAARRAVERTVPGPVVTPGGPATGARGGDERVAALGRSLADAFPQAAQAVASSLAAAAEKGRAGLEKFMQDAVPDRRERALFELVRGLERFREFAGGELVAKVVDLQVAALRELHVPEADVATFQSADDAKTRLMILARLAFRYASAERERGAHPFLGRDRSRFPRLGGGMSEGMSDGMSDEPPPGK